jgi:hypothetical protein
MTTHEAMVFPVFTRGFFATGLNGKITMSGGAATDANLA